MFAQRISMVAQKDVCLLPFLAYGCHVSSIGVLYVQHRGAIFERRDTILFGGAHALQGFSFSILV